LQRFQAAFNQSKGSLKTNFPNHPKGTTMKPTAPLAAILLSITLAPAHALVIHPDIWFSSDNGNIQCGGYSQYGSGVICEIYQRTDNIQPRTARPEACQKRDWGYRFALDDYGAARVFFVDDKLRNLSATPLANGATQRRKNWQCTAQAHGITCQNADKHGFTLTRSQQRLF